MNARREGGIVEEKAAVQGVAAGAAAAARNTLFQLVLSQLPIRSNVCEQRKRRTLVALALGQVNKTLGALQAAHCCQLSRARTKCFTGDIVL